MKSWSEIQRCYPFFWLWLNTWLKKKDSQSIQIFKDLNSEYIKIRFSYKERELSEEMIHDVLDEAGIRVCINFNAEDTQPAWRYIVYKNNGIKNLWTQIYTSDYIFKKRMSASREGFLFAIKEHNESLKKQNAIGQY